MVRNFSVKQIFSLVLILTLLMVFVSCEKQDPRLNEYEYKRAALYLEKQDYINEQYALRTGIEEYAGNNSFMSFVFTDLDSGLYSDVLPLMLDDEIPLEGVVALSVDELPGMEGKITFEQYADLMALGWETAIYWEGIVSADDSDAAEAEEADLSAMSQALDSYLESMSAVLESLGIEMPKSLVLGCEILADEYESASIKYGIRNILRDDTVHNDLIASHYPEGIWCPGILGWRDLRRSTRVKNAVENNGGYSTFKINFDNSQENFDTSFYSIDGESTLNGVREDVFAKMLLKFRTSIAQGLIEVVGIDEARERTKNYYDAKENYLINSEIRTAELDVLIEDVDRRIVELYNEYFGTGGQ